LVTGKKIFSRKKKINLDGNKTPLTFALPIKKRVLFHREKQEKKR
jgi:hypothetical protein